MDGEIETNDLRFRSQKAFESFQIQLGIFYKPLNSMFRTNHLNYFYGKSNIFSRNSKVASVEISKVLILLVGSVLEKIFYVESCFQLF